MTMAWILVVSPPRDLALGLDPGVAWSPHCVGSSFFGRQRCVDVREHLLNRSTCTRHRHPAPMSPEYARKRHSCISGDSAGGHARRCRNAQANHASWRSHALHGRDTGPIAIDDGIDEQPIVGRRTANVTIAVGRKSLILTHWSSRKAWRCICRPPCCRQPKSQRKIDLGIPKVTTTILAACEHNAGVARQTRIN
jgi:hypothetical protein